VGIQQIHMSKLHTFLLLCCGLEESPLRKRGELFSPCRETYVQKLVESAHNHYRGAACADQRVLNFSRTRAISFPHSLPPPPCLLTHRGLLGLLPERSELTCFDTCIRTFHAQQEADVRSVDIKLEHLHVHPHVGWFTDEEVSSKEVEQRTVRS